MKKYNEPKFKVVSMSFEDVISTSGMETGSGSSYTPGNYDTPIIIIPKH